MIMHMCKVFNYKLYIKQQLKTEKWVKLLKKFSPGIKMLKQYDVMQLIHHPALHWLWRVPSKYAVWPTIFQNKNLNMMKCSPLPQHTNLMKLMVSRKHISKQTLNQNKLVLTDNPVPLSSCCPDDKRRC